MKQGTTCRLAVVLSTDLDDVTRVEFAFAQTKDAGAQILKGGAYPDDYDRREGTNIIDVTWTAEETRLFTAGARFYMDTRVTLADGNMPETPIVTLIMRPTLFEED